MLDVGWRTAFLFWVLMGVLKLSESGISATTIPTAPPPPGSCTTSADCRTATTNDGYCVTGRCVCPFTNDQYGDCYLVCPDNWQRAKTPAGRVICVKAVAVAQKYGAAQIQCRQDFGHLLVLGDDLDVLTAVGDVYPNLQNTLATNELWTGMHKEYGKLWWEYNFPTPVKDGSTWTWASGQPWQTNETCGTVEANFGGTNLTSHKVQLRSCNNPYPFVCMKDPLVFNQTAASAVRLVSGLRCSPGWKGHPHMPDMCLRLVSEHKTWPDARTHCQGLGGDLAEPRTWLNNSFITWTLTSAGDNAWVGAEYTSAAPRQLRLVVSGITLANSPFYDGLPTPASGGQCVAVERGSHYGSPNWQVKSCTTAGPFICQIPRSRKAISRFIVNPQSHRAKVADPFKLQCSAENVDITTKKIWNKDGVYMTEQQVQVLTPLEMPGVYWCESWALDPYRRMRSLPAHVAFTDLLTFGIDMRAPSVTYTPSIYDSFNLYPQSSSSLSTNIVQVFNAALPTSVGNGITLNHRTKITGFSRGSTIFHTSVSVEAQGAVGSTDDDAQAELETSIKDALLGGFQQSLSTPGVTRTTLLAWGVTMAEISVHSSSYCPQERVLVGTAWLTFPRTARSRVADSEETCLSNGQATATRACVSPLPAAVSVGARWGSVVTSTATCPQNHPTSTSTTGLQTLAGETPTVIDSNPGQYADQGANLTQNTEELEYSDVVLASQVLNNLADSQAALNDIGNVLADMVKIVDNVMESNRSSLKTAQELGSSGSRIKKAMEAYARGVVLPNVTEVEVVEPNLAMEVIDLEDKGGFVGFEIDGDINAEQAFKANDIKQLGTAADLQNTQANAGVIFPKALVDKVVDTSSDNAKARISVIAYRDGRLFQTNNPTSNLQADSLILSVQMGNGLSMVSRPADFGVDEPIKLYFKRFKGTTPVCGFWNFTLKDDGANETGTWDTNGCSFEGYEGDLVVCECNHLTNFAVLLNVAGDDIDSVNLFILGLITKIGLSVSIAALGLTLVTFIAFPPLRKNLSQQVLFSLCIALLCSNILFLVGIDRTESWEVCTVISALLMYFLLAAFCWMLVEAVLQYLRFVKVLGTYIPRFMLKASIPSWLFPAVFVAALAAWDYEKFIGDNSYCWLDKKALLYFFLPPVALIIVVNTILFIMIVRGITNRPKMKTNQSERKMAMLQVRASIATLVVLGLTWVFGFFAISEATLPFQYIFCILNSFQGLLIFALHLAREKTVQRQWVKCCCPKKYARDKYGQSSSTFNTSKNRTRDTETEEKRENGHRSKNSAANSNQPSNARTPDNQQTTNGNVSHTNGTSQGVVSNGGDTRQRHTTGSSNHEDSQHNSRL